MIAKVFVLAFLVTIVYPSPVDEQKPFDCPPNEKYYKYSLQICWKTCDHLLTPPPCPQLAANCYKPGCECIDNHLRDKQGKCIPVDKCPQSPIALK